MIKLLCSLVMLIAFSGHLPGSETATYPDLHRVYFSDAQNGYAVGTLTAAVVFRTEDGGAWLLVRRRVILEVQCGRTNEGWE